MKVSEAIDRLETIMEEEGDIEVFTDTEGDFGDPTTIAVEGEGEDRYVSIQADAIEEDEITDLEEEEA